MKSKNFTKESWQELCDKIPGSLKIEEFTLKDGGFYFKQRIEPACQSLFETTLPQDTTVMELSVDNNKVILKGFCSNIQPSYTLRSIGFIEHPPEDPEGKNFDLAVGKDLLVSKHFPFQGNQCRLAIRQKLFK